MRLSEERSDSKSIAPPSYITNNLPLVASFFASPIITTIFAIRFAHRSSTDKENHFRIKHSNFKVRDLAAEDQVWLDAWTDLIEKTISKAQKNKEMAGWLFKKDKRGKQGWKRRYCIISADGVLRYYEQPDDLVCKGHLDLKGGGAEMVGGDKIGKRRSSLRESIQGGKFLFNLKLEDQTRQFYSER